MSSVLKVMFGFAPVDRIGFSGLEIAAHWLPMQPKVESC